MSATVAVVGGVQVDVVMLPVPDLPPGGQSLLVDDMSFRVGGAGANAALALAAAGGRVRLFGCVGGDHLGSWLARELAPYGLDGELTAVAGQGTGLTVALEAPGRDRTFLTYLGVNTAWSAQMLPADATDVAGLLLCDYFCLPGFRGAPASELLGAARGRGARTFFDSAWDPGGWPAATREEVLGLLPLVDVFLPNEAEAAALLAQELAPEEAARRLQQASGGWVVVKLAERGCVAAGPDGERLAATAVPLSATDTTGAGDAFNAGVIAALTAGGAMQEALEAGVELAARIIARPSHERHPAARAR